MEFGELAGKYGPLLAIIVTALVSVIGTFKIAIPRLVDAWIEDRRVQRETEVEVTMGERQEDITLLSQMVNLTNQVVTQNRALITFITEEMSDDIKGLRNETLQALRDIEQRWLSASREMAETKGRTHILSMEVARLADTYKALEERVVSLVAFGLENVKFGKTRHERSDQAAPRAED